MCKDKKMLKYAKLSFYSKRKRLKKKAKRRLLELSGYDKEGNRNYAKAAEYILKVRKF